MKKQKIYRVIVTGGNNGIGLALTNSLLKRGHKVAVFDLSGENGSNDHENFLFCRCDITKQEEVKSSVKKVVEQFKGIDILVNNACLAHFNAFETKTIEDFKKEFEVNFFGALNCIYGVLPVMKEQKSGLIHNVSSGVGVTGFANLPGYTSTKGALEALTKTLRIELNKYNINVNIIHPPLTKTNSATPLGIPLEMMAKPEKVGEGIAKRIASKKKIITPNLNTKIFTRLSYMMPYKIGSLLSKMTEKARKETISETSETKE